MNTKKATPTAEVGVDLARFLNLPVYYFDLESVLEATNSTLAGNRESLRAICDQLLAEVSPNEVTVQAGSGFYLIVQSVKGEDAAEGVAQKLNLALLTTLFGSASLVPDNFRMLFRSVRAGAEPAAAPANEDTAPELEHEEFDEAEQSPSREPRDAYGELAMRGQLTSQNVELFFEPVHDLLRGRSTTFFCTPAFCVGGAPVIHGYRAFEGVSPRDMPYIDRAMLAHSLKFARRLAAAGVPTAIGAPVSFETLAWSRGREIYQEALRAAGVPDYPSIVICIKDLPVGVTASRIAEFVGYLRPLAKRVFVHLPDSETPVLNCGFLGANGFVLSMPTRQSSTQSERIATWLARVGEAQTALTTIDQIGNDLELDAVRRANVRFGMGPVFGPNLFRGSAAPIEVESFMKAAARAAQSEGRNVHRFGPRKAAAARLEKSN